MAGIHVVYVPEIHLVRGEPEEGVDDGGGGDVVKVAQLLRPHRAGLGHR